MAKRNYKVVISGGPGSGKTMLISILQNRGFQTFEEYSRTVIRNGFEGGYENYFKTKPDEFSKAIFQGRIRQWEKANALPLNKTKPYIFFDRGIPDTYAYLQADGKNTSLWEKQAIPYVYDHIFLLEPWLEIYHTDNERMEPFHEAKRYYVSIKKTYEALKCPIDIVPKGTPENRIEFILNILDYG